MPRVAALLLLVPLAPPVRAAAPELKAFCWSAPPTTCRYLTPLVWLRQGGSPAAAAAEAARLPAGRRALFSWDLHRDILNHPDDVCRTADGQPTGFRGVWPEHGVAATRERFTRLFTEFKAAGGAMDYVILDFEGGYSNWSLGGADQLARYRAIQADPRFAALAAKLGFDDLSLVANWAGKRNYLKWNAVLGGQVAAALRQAIFEPARAAFPAVQGSNYEDLQLREADAVPDLNGHLQWSESELMGTANSPSLYTWIGQLGDRQLDGKQPYGRSPLAGLRLSLNLVRAVQRSSDKPLMPWLAWWRYAGDGPGRPVATVANTPYWRELVLHLALAGTETYLFWDPHPWAKSQAPESLSLPSDETFFDGILDELNRRLAGAVRQPLTTEPIPWDAPLLVTGMRVDDRSLWRVTVPAGVKQVTVQAGERRETLPVEADGAGAWFVAPADGPVPAFTAG